MGTSLPFPGHILPQVLSLLFPTTSYGLQVRLYPVRAWPRFIRTQRRRAVFCVRLLSHTGSRVFSGARDWGGVLLSLSCGLRGSWDPRSMLSAGIRLAAWTQPPPCLLGFCASAHPARA